MKKSVSVLIAASFFALLFVSCGKKNNSVPAKYEYENSYNDVFASKTAVKSLGNSYELNDFEEVFTAEYEYDSSAPVEEGFERKLVKEGNIRIKVDSLDEADSQIESWAKKFGGYVSNSNMSKYTYSYNVRIPSKNFDEAMNVIDGLGKLVSRSINIDDVSERYYDLSGRLDAKKILQQKYSQYLKQAQNMQDLLEIERQLNDVTSELEYIQGQLQRLSNQIDYSTIYITLEANVPSYTTQRHIKGFAFKDFLYDVGDFFVGFLKTIIYIIVYGIPILIFVSFMYWLLLGKIGLLKKLFILLHGKVNFGFKNKNKEKSDE